MIFDVLRRKEVTPGKLFCLAQSSEDVKQFAALSFSFPFYDIADFNLLLHSDHSCNQHHPVCCSD